MEKQHQTSIRLVFGMALGLTLAACGGPGGGGGGSGSGSGSSSADWATASYAGNFDETAAAAYRQTPEFKNTSAYCQYYGCASSGPLAPATQADAFGLINVHVAHTAGLTGQGQLVAIVDNGFRTTHQEFAGKTLYQYGTLPVLDHGTHVAGLVAAKRDGIGMMGVAPDASLHLASFDPNQASTFNFSNVIGATNDAASKGAVAQNNSWGFDVSAKTIADYLNNNPGASLSDALAANIGYSTTQWASYISALKNFQKTGVIVFAETNKTNYADGTAVSSMAAFDADLQKAWIAVVNGYYEIDAQNKITDAVRISGQCGYAAPFCLAADGTTTSAAASSDTAYAAGTGTSYVAPQVSGAVALLAQAFPSLTPEQWVDRLLASANNTWFPAKGVPVAGSVDFGNGITHKYSSEWGHGVLDLKAALSPIGSLSLLSGDNVVTAQRTDLAQAGLSAPQAYGDGLAKGLADRDVAVFDALNGNFSIKAQSLVHSSTATTQLVLPALNASSFSPQTALAFDQSADKDLVLPEGAKLGFTTDLSTTLAGPSAARGTSALSLASDSVALSGSQDLGPFRLEYQAFAGASTVSDSALSGAGLALNYDFGDSHIKLGITQMLENGAVLGLSGGGALSLSSNSALTSLRLDAGHKLNDNLSLFAGLEAGLAQTLGASGTLVTGTSPLNYSGLRAGLTLDRVAEGGGRWTLAIAQPLRIETGVAHLSLPTGRDKNGDLSYQSLSVPLTPSGRELDLSADYSLPFGDSATFALSALYAFDAGHVAGAQRVAFGAGVRGQF